MCARHALIGSEDQLDPMGEFDTLSSRSFNTNSASARNRQQND